MVITNLFKCLSDSQRLRVINLLSEGALCVCHLLEILEADAIKMSKQLAYMKRLGVLQVEREANWKIYRVEESYQKLVKKEMKLLRKYEAELPLLVDLQKRESILTRLRKGEESCPDQVLQCC